VRQTASVWKTAHHPSSTTLGRRHRAAQHGDAAEEEHAEQTVDDEGGRAVARLLGIGT
jgi:hypothetical protein